ncbi:MULTISPECIES: hypothetical protein [unclassified Rhizobium]|uniref:hypothetical protein n=1 Tax=unclassified Rhizobium TaxID=2613769 RepID=UPI001615B333|nr:MULTISPECIES: hypothetical protein [unclassified Rhizobium]MBB3540489.1 hypothetical protein [Rhizobium sp. BK399]MCS3738501.1 hypothetical protein [Rhizobium sp. BK661]MCS4091621.1 hypothetical protein [Rhizobium sp. BK176]
MFMDRLFNETQRLAAIFSALEALRLADERGNPRGWASPFGLLQIIRCCARILELSSCVAKAGYRECDQETLEAITSETRQVLYSVRAQIAA